MATDPRFLTNDSRLQHWPELEQCLNNAASKKTIAEWCDILDKAGIPAGPLNNMAQALKHPQVAARGIVTTIPHPVAGDIQCIASPVRLSQSPRDSYTHSPVLGADTANYVAEILGCSLEEATKLVQNGDLL